MEKNGLFNDFKFLPFSRILENHTKKVEVVFIYKHYDISKTLYIPHKKGAKEDYYINEAKKVINQQIKSGELKKYSEGNINKRKKKKGFLIFLCCLLGASALAGAGVGIYYAIPQPQPDPDIPPAGEEFTEIKWVAEPDIPDGNWLKDDEELHVKFTFEAVGDVEVDWGDGSLVKVTSPATSPVLTQDTTIKIYGNTSKICFAELVYDEEEDESEILPYDWGNSYIMELTTSKYVTEIPDYGCATLVFCNSLNLPNVHVLGEQAFAYNQLLPSFNIPRCMETIKSGAFVMTISLKSITIEEGNKNFVVSNGCLVDIKNKTLITAYTMDATIPTDLGIQTIGDYAFASRMDFAEHETMKLNLYVPNTVTKFGKFAFSDIIITKFEFEENSALETIDYYCFGNTEIEGNFVLPNTIKEIGGMAFQGTEANFDNGTLNCPTNLTSIGEYAFSISQSGLEKVVFNEKITSIADQAFRGANDLEEVDATVFTPTKFPTVGQLVFSTIGSHVPSIIVASQNVKDALSADSGWSAYIDLIEVKG